MDSNLATRCHHVRVSGVRCGSPALHDKRYCYYHQRSRPLLINLGKREGDDDIDILMPFPTLEDAHAIQFALRHVVIQHLNGALNAKRTGLMLYALQIASNNLKRMNAETPKPEDLITEVPSLSENPRPISASEPSSDNAHSYRLAGHPPSPTPTFEEQYRDDLMCQVREVHESLDPRARALRKAEENNKDCKIDEVKEVKDEPVCEQKTSARLSTDNSNQHPQPDPTEALQPGTIHACIDQTSIDQACIDQACIDQIWIDPSEHVN